MEDLSSLIQLLLNSKYNTTMGLVRDDFQPLRDYINTKDTAKHPLYGFIEMMRNDPEIFGIDSQGTYNVGVVAAVIGFVIGHKMGNESNISLDFETLLDDLKSYRDDEEYGL